VGRNREIPRKRDSNIVKKGYFARMKTMPQSMPGNMAKLKPALLEKIERMDDRHLILLNRILLQLEVEERADRLNEAFDKDHEQGLLRRVPELVKQFRSEHRYA
jgi:hypothetical protein